MALGVGLATGPLQAHHVKPWATHPQHRLDVANGLALCPECHGAEHPSQAAALLTQRRPGDYRWPDAHRLPDAATIEEATAALLPEVERQLRGLLTEAWSLGGTIDLAPELRLVTRRMADAS